MTPVDVLFIGSRPRDLGALRLKDEFSRIVSRVRPRLDGTPGLTVEAVWGQEFDELPALLDRYQPLVLHLSGHGDAKDGFFFEDALGRGAPVRPALLARLFGASAVRGRIRCVILNACEQGPTAQQLSKHVDFVVASDEAMSDDSAIAYAATFLPALSRGMSVCEAHRTAKVMYSQAGGTHFGPRLWVKDGVDRNLPLDFGRDPGCGPLVLPSVDPYALRHKEWTLAMPGALKDLPDPLPPEFDLHAWLVERGAACHRESHVELTVWNLSASDTVMICRIDAEVERKVPHAGTKVRCPPAGDMRVTVLSFDLDRPGAPAIEETLSYDDPVVGKAYFEHKYVNVAPRSAHRFRIIGRARRCWASWRLVVHYAVAGVQTRLVVDDRGRPFETSGDPPTGFASELTYDWHEDGERTLSPEAG